MANEEKELLLKDLCARLPYGNTEIKETELTNDMMGEVFVGKHICSTIDIEYFILGKYIIRPYLRPLSSMTDEEKELLKEEHIKDEQLYINCIEKSKMGDNSMRGKVIPHFAADWCNKNHFDYRGLIPMGLALEATEKMYKS